MYYKFNGFTQRLVGAAASAAYNPQVTGAPPPAAPVTFAVLFLTRSPERLGPPAELQPGEAAGGAAWGGLGVEGVGEGTPSAWAIASPAGTGLPGSGFGDPVAFNSLRRDREDLCPHTPPTPSPSKPGLSPDLGRDETLRAALHLLTQLWDVLGVTARNSHAPIAQDSPCLGVS